jgi:exonuclease VII large subunit
MKNASDPSPSSQNGSASSRPRQGRRCATCSTPCVDVFPLSRCSSLPRLCREPRRRPRWSKPFKPSTARRPDVILIARGGGSIEDLWAFNDERVVRAVAASEVPVIAGVGHETDFTLCDFAADLRAPTPTAAAELATQITVLDLQAGLQNYLSRIATSAFNLIVEKKSILSSLISELRHVSPTRRIRSETQRVDELSRRMHSSLIHRIQLQSSHIKGMARRLEALSPLAVLARGYAVVTRKKDGKVVSRVALADDEMKVRVSDGEFEVKRQSLNTSKRKFLMRSNLWQKQSKKTEKSRRTHL